MALSRKTLDIDLITLRTVNIKGYKNSIIPSSSVLLSDGLGGTYWSFVSTVGTYPSFQQINIDSNSYSATPTAQNFSFLTGNGIGFTDVGPGSNATYLYAKAFQTVAVPGLSSLTAFTSNTLTPTLTLSSLGGLQISTDTTHQVIYFNAGIKYFNVISNTSTFTSNLTGITPTSFPITPLLSTLSFLGVGDITLTPTPTNTVSIGINGFTSAGYNTLSGEVFTLQSTILTKASTLFIYKKDFYNTISSFSSIIGNQISSYQISTTYLNLSTFAMSNISTYSTLYSSLSTTVSFQISTLSSYFYALNQSTLSTFIYNNLASTIVGYSSIYSSITGYNISSALIALSSYYMVQTSTNSSIYALTSLLNSTNFSTFALTSTIIGSTLALTAGCLSSMSTTMSIGFLSSFTPRLNLVSSLLYRDSTRKSLWGDGIQFSNYNPPGYGVLLSTVVFNFSNLSNAFTSQKISVTIEYNPVILFPMANSLANSANYNPQYISTYIAYQPVSYTSVVTPLDGTTYTDTLMINQFNSNNDAVTSNTYSKYIRLTLDSAQVRNTNFLGNYIIYHYLPTAFQVFGGRTVPVAISINSTLHIRTSLQNSLFLNIFNL